MAESVMKREKKAAIAACSDPVSPGRIPEIYRVKEKLLEAGIYTEVVSGYFDGTNPSPSMKAKYLMECFRDPRMDYIFDVSGGDLANFVLPYLDYDVISESRALFFGYSDLTTVINAIIAKTGRYAVNYQVRNLLYECARDQFSYFTDHILPGLITTDDLELEFVRGSSMQGRILGGNIRCFLKLAGTEYWPDMEGSILLLESMGGGVYQMMTALEQYRQIGVFDQISGIVLGTFSRMEQEQQKPAMEELVLNIVPERVSVAKTRYIGHYSDARAILLGKPVIIR